MSAVRWELWSDLQCVNGSYNLGQLDVITGTYSEQLDNTDEATATFRSDPRVVVSLRKVVRIIDTAGTVREYRIQSLTRTLANGVRSLRAVSPLYDLATAGLYRTVSGVADYGFTVAASMTSIIDTHVLSNLADDNINYFARGTVDPPASESITFTIPDEGYTRLQILQQAVSQTVTASELRLRRNGSTGYYIDVLTRVGSTANTVTVAQGKNLLSLNDALNDGDLATAITVHGVVTAGIPAGLSENAWTLGTIPGAAPYWIPLTDPNGGAGPVAFASQFGTATGSQPAYLLLADQTLLQVTDSRTTPDNAVLVAATTGLTAGAEVQIVADSSGNRLLELRAPSQPRLWRRDSAPTLRGERNLATNGKLLSWTSDILPANWGTTAGARYPYTTPTTLVLTVTSTVANLTAVPVNGPANAQIYFKDRFTQSGSVTANLQTLGYVKLDGSGNGTLSLEYFSGATSPGATSGDVLTLSAGTYSTRLLSPGDTAGADALRIDPLGSAITPTIYVTPVGALFIVNCAVGLTLQTSTTRASGAYPLTVGLPNVTLTNTDTPATIATGSLSTSLSGGVTLQTSIVCGAGLTVPTHVNALINAAIQSDCATYVRWVAFWLSTAVATTAPDLIYSANANALWQRANRGLLARTLGTRSISASLRDLSTAAGYSITRESLTLGGSVYLADLGLTVRIVGITYRSENPQDVTVVLDSRPPRLTQLLAERV